MTSGNVFPRFSRPGGFGGEMMSCRDVAFDGGFVAKGDTEQDSLQPAAEHARAVHNLNEITPGIAEKGKSTIQADAARISTKQTRGAFVAPLSSSFISHHTPSARLSQWFPDNARYDVIVTGRNQLDVPIWDAR
jgi:predicted small metal-binding protein